MSALTTAIKRLFTTSVVGKKINITQGLPYMLSYLGIKETDDIKMKALATQDLLNAPHKRTITSEQKEALVFMEQLLRRVAKKQEKEETTSLAECTDLQIAKEKNTAVADSVKHYIDRLDRLSTISDPHTSRKPSP